MAQVQQHPQGPWWWRGWVAAMPWGPFPSSCPRGCNRSRHQQHQRLLSRLPTGQDGVAAGEVTSLELADMSLCQCHKSPANNGEGRRLRARL